MRVSTRVFPTRHTPTGVRFRASLTTAAVDRGRPVACRVERYLSPLLFYGVVERFSSASKVCVWCTTAGRVMALPSATSMVLGPCGQKIA
jgi:hypothetical protein